MRGPVAIRVLGAVAEGAVRTKSSRIRMPRKSRSMTPLPRSVRPASRAVRRRGKGGSNIDVTVKNRLPSDHGEQARMNPSERAAVVTGGAGGLGSATVRHLVKIGLHVVVFDRD